MIKQKLLTIINLILVSVPLGLAQPAEHFTGILLDDSEIQRLEDVPAVATQVTRSYSNLPRKCNLLQFAPKCGDQGQFGTCVGWATGYCALTIAEAVNSNWLNEDQVTSEALSPIFVYSLIKQNKGCQKGTYLTDALVTLKENGSPKLAEYNVKCDGDVKPANHLFVKAKEHRIETYNKVHSPEMRKAVSLQNIKKSISEFRPVVISMKLNYSFNFMNGKSLWEPQGSGDHFVGNHAMVIVGYDDDKFGGSFLIQNSWGQEWGDKGRIWVKYDDFFNSANYAFELYMPKQSPINPAKVEKNRFAGSISISLSNGEQMKFSKSKSEKFTTFESIGKYLSGTRYRIYLDNNKPAYVYVIASDNTKSVSRVFPPNDKISASLSYTKNTIALPDEKYFIEMDNTTGTDNLCMIFSKEPIDIKSVSKAISHKTGSFQQRVIDSLNPDNVTIPQYNSSDINFDIETSRTIVPVFINIKHI